MEMGEFVAPLPAVFIFGAPRFVRSRENSTLVFILIPRSTTGAWEQIT